MVLQIYDAGGFFNDFTGERISFYKKNNMQDKEKRRRKKREGEGTLKLGFFYTGARASSDLTKIFLLLFTGIHIHRLNTQGGLAHGSTRDEVIVL